jgi:hypothetical protein
MPRFSFPSSSSSSHRVALEQTRWVLGVSLLLLYYGASGYGGGALSRGAFSHMSLRATTTTTAVVVSADTDRVPSNFYVFWLMPVAEDAERLQATIMNDLVHAYHSVSIDPHVTLGPPVPVANIPYPPQALERLTTSKEGSPRLRGSAGPPRVVCATGATADSGSTYTQSVFLRFDRHTPALDDLYQTSRHVSGLPFESPIPTTDYFPHLSVWYENASREERQSVAARTQAKLDASPLDQICFDRVQLMRIQLPVTSRQDVQNWQVVASAPLARDS